MTEPEPVDAELRGDVTAATGGTVKPDGTAADAVAADSASDDVRTAAARGRRELGSTLLAMLVGAAVVLAVAGRTWVDVTVPRQPPFAAIPVQLSGRDLFPALSGLAIVAMIVAVLVLVTGGWARRVLGAVTLVIAASCGWYAIRGLGRPSNARVEGLVVDKLSQRAGTLVSHPHPVWPALALVGAVLVALAAVALLLRSGSWRSGLSGRYSAPAEAARADDPWRRLDRGEDPTVRSD